MSACQGLGLLALVMVSGIIIGFVLGCCATKPLTCAAGPTLTEIDMHHAITIGGLLLALGILGGLLATALGLLMLFAAGMSDAGDDGTGGKGCLLAIVGIVLAIAWLFL